MSDNKPNVFVQVQGPERETLIEEQMQTGRVEPPALGDSSKHCDGVSTMHCDFDWLGGFHPTYDLPHCH